jgi:hypothetical protein
MQERVGNHACKLRPLEQTTTMGRIQENLAAAIERLLEVRPIHFGEGFGDDGPVCPGGVPTALMQPLLFFPIPKFEDFVWNRIVCSKRLEARGVSRKGRPRNQGVASRRSPGDN